MNILFLTMNIFTGIEMHNIYSELMKEFIAHGHKPFIVTPREKITNGDTALIDFGSYSILKVKIGNISNVSLVEKGISTVTLNWKYRRAVLKYLGDVQFDLILYSTPPITLAGTIEYLKRRFKCRTYLMLKDIFPQNAVDLGMIKENSILHKYFRKQEQNLYLQSDMIGCMSAANVQYIIQHNHYIDAHKVEVCPNAISPKQRPDKIKSKQSILKKYNIPENTTIFMYGGNLGKPQGIPFLVEVLRKVKDDENSYFIICGSGSEYRVVEEFVISEKPRNIMLSKELPKEEYDNLLSGCDVGMIFLDYQFTIPNYPSRMLSYMEQMMPIVAFTDLASDVGNTINDGEFGWWGPSDDSTRAVSLIKCISQNKEKIVEFGLNSRRYLENNFTVNEVYSKIMNN